MQDERVFNRFVAWVRNVRREGLWIHVHVSTPCTLGSPLKHFGGQKDDEELHDEWKQKMTHASWVLEKR